MSALFLVFGLAGVVLAIVAVFFFLANIGMTFTCGFGGTGSNRSHKTQRRPPGSIARGPSAVSVVWGR